ncbi:nuclear transport factor 2 family protein [Phenylobacterium sp.]|uniref:nuclear transport factor 2 family protein n=1 Tax=Phenylobacterium sp. TaxID=1871053 RepID=UPI0035644948
MPQLRTVMAACGLLVLASAAAAHPPTPSSDASASGPTADAGAGRVVDDFHAALARGDTAAAANLLSAAVIIFEGGTAERSRSEYAGAHLPADAAFEQAIGSKLARRSGGRAGDLAWVASEGQTKGQFKGRDIDRVTTETMVLRRTTEGWKIVHVHWSSRAVTAAH